MKVSIAVKPAIACITLALSAFFCTVPPAQAMLATVVNGPSGCGISLSGSVDAADLLQFEKVAGESPQCKVISLDIRNGLMAPAIGIGRAIRARSMITVVPPKAVCSGVCVWILAGGVQRVVDPQGAVGLQAVSLARNDAMQREVRNIITHYGPAASDAIIASIEKGNAQILGAVVSHLVKMGLSPALFEALVQASPQSPRWLSTQEIQDWGLSTPRKPS